MNKKKVVHLLTGLGAGGAETNLLALLKCFDRDRYEHLIAFGGEAGVLEKEFDKLGVGLLRISSKPLRLLSVLEASRMLSHIKACEPDLIHCHLDLANMVGLAAKKKYGFKIVLHLHGLGMVPHEVLPGRPFKHRLWNLLARRYKNADRIIAICDFQLPFLESLGVAREQISLIPNGISIGNPEPVDRSPREEYRFVSIGRFFKQKNHHMLIRAFAQVAGDFPEARLILVGDGPLRSEIEKLVFDQGLDDKVDFLGVRRDIPGILANSDCFVLSSVWELHPITILEAMRSALPVISTSVGGVDSTVIDGETGVLVDSGDERGFAAAMRSMLESRSRGKEMGSEGMRVVRDRFDNKKVAVQIEEVYDTVIGVADAH